MTMPERHIELHLCNAGFGAVYEGFLTHRLRTRLTVPATDPAYWEELLDLIKKNRDFSKPAAIQGVMALIRAGTPHPMLIQSVLEKAIQLASPP